MEKYGPMSGLQFEIDLFEWLVNGSLAGPLIN